MGKITRSVLGCILTCGSLAVVGCSFGPRMIEKTHGQYGESVRNVYEEQLLRNIIHLRYNEGPLALNVSSIATQYELSAQAEARPFFSTEATGNLFRSFSRVLPDVLASGANRPTITFDPADDSQAIRQFLTPISADTLAFLIETGRPVSTLLRLWVERLNGVPNAAPVSGPRDHVFPDFARFQRAAELLQVAHDQQLITLRTEDRLTPVSGPLQAEAVTAAAAVEAAKNQLELQPSPGGKTWVLTRRERRLVLEITPGAERLPELTELAHLLNLIPGLRQYDIVLATGVPDPLRHPSPPTAEIRVETRSTAQAHLHLSNGVELPAEHLKAGVVALPVDETGRALDGREITSGLFAVSVTRGHKPPPSAYVAVLYRGCWFYVDDRDHVSKATLALMLHLARLDFGREQTRRSGPLLTLPVGR